MPGSEAVSTLHWPKNDILSFFKFLQKKVSRLDKNTPANFCITLGVIIWKNHVAKHQIHSISAGNFFCQARKLVFAEI